MNTPSDRRDRALDERHRATAALLRDVLEREARSIRTPPAPDLDRLLDLAAHPVPGRGEVRARTLPRTLAATAAAAAVVVTGSLVAVRATDTPATAPDPISAVSPPVPGTSMSTDAHTALLQIADVARSTPLDAPRPDQFTYAKTLISGEEQIATVAGDRPGITCPVLRRTGDHDTSEVWTPQSPRGGGLVRTVTAGHVDQFALDTSGGAPGPGVPDLSTYAGLLAAPVDDPKALAAAVVANGNGGRLDTDTDTSAVLRHVVQLDLPAQVLPPDFAAGLYRTLAGLPGITLTQNVTDLAGRRGVAIGAADRAGERYDIIFDPRTFTPLGTREYPAAAGPDNRLIQDGCAGLDTRETAILAVAVVDRAGRLPS